MKSVFFLLILAVFSFGGILAQDQEEGSKVPSVRKGEMVKYSDEQKAMLKQITENRKSFKSEFEATVSQQQKDILENPRLMPMERRKEYRASYTDRQVEMIKKHNAEMKNLRDEFRSSLTEQQQADLKRIKSQKKPMEMRRPASDKPFCPCCPCGKGLKPCPGPKEKTQTPKINAD